MFADMITFSTELPDIVLLQEFEKQHPEKLRWGIRVKTKNFYSEWSHYIYLKKDDVIVGEAILGWQNDEWINVDSFTILPEYQSQGLGKLLLEEVIKRCESYEWKEIRATTKQPVSSGLFLNLGFKQKAIAKNWGGTGLDYVEVSKKINIMNKLPKLLIIGPARHGKDTLAELLNENFGLRFVSSSQAAADIFIYNELKDKYGYKTPEECFEDRFNHRKEWYDMICDYNKDDKTRLAKGILELNDCYVGMRDKREIENCMNENLFDLVIWVDASKRLPLEDSSSFNIDISIADIIIDNNGTFEQFKNRVLRLGKVLSK